MDGVGGGATVVGSFWVYLNKQNAKLKGGEREREREQESGLAKNNLSY